MPRENPEEIEKEVLSEIKRALGVDEPPTSISIPPGSIPAMTRSPKEASTLDSEDTDSLDEDERLLLEQLKDVVDRRTSSSNSPSAGRDSFLKNLSWISSGGGGSTATGSSTPGKLFLEGSLDQGSVPSRVPEDGQNEDYLSHDELVSLVQRLYEKLRQTDDDVSAEKTRRKHREKSLMKLAKELARLKDVIKQHESKMEETKEELQKALTEKAMLQQQLEMQKQANTAKDNDMLAQTDTEVQAVVRQYEALIADHEERINEMNKNHAKHCEQLCKEVVEANQESMRLQKRLAEITNGGFTVERKIAESIPMTRSVSSKSTKRRSPKKNDRVYGTTMVLLAAGYMWYNFDGVRHSAATFLHERLGVSRPAEVMENVVVPEQDVASSRAPTKIHDDIAKNAASASTPEADSKKNMNSKEKEPARIRVTPSVEMDDMMTTTMGNSTGAESLENELTIKSGRARFRNFVVMLKHEVEEVVASGMMN